VRREASQDRGWSGRHPLAGVSASGRHVVDPTCGAIPATSSVVAPRILAGARVYAPAIATVDAGERGFVSRIRAWSGPAGSALGLRSNVEPHLRRQRALREDYSYSPTSSRGYGASGWKGEPMIWKGEPMIDDKQKKVPADSSRVSLEDDYEVRFWCSRFGCSRAELEYAVRIVGHISTAVQTYLAKSHPVR
jgi:hypothetical protein